MDVWVVKMNVKQPPKRPTKTYLVVGSGLFPVPEARANEIPTLRKAFHQQELKRAWLTVFARRAP
jgi:hypothetical protein